MPRTQNYQNSEALAIREANRRAYNKLSQHEQNILKHVCDKFIENTQIKYRTTHGLSQEAVLEILASLFKREHDTGQLIFDKGR